MENQLLKPFTISELKYAPDAVQNIYLLAATNTLIHPDHLKKTVISHPSYFNDAIKYISVLQRRDVELEKERIKFTHIQNKFFGDAKKSVIHWNARK